MIKITINENGDGITIESPANVNMIIPTWEKGPRVLASDKTDLDMIRVAISICEGRMDALDRKRKNLRRVMEELMEHRFRAGMKEHQGDEE